MKRAEVKFTAAQGQGLALAPACREVAWLC